MCLSINRFDHGETASGNNLQNRNAGGDLLGHDKQVLFSFFFASSREATSGCELIKNPGEILDIIFFLDTTSD